MMNSDKLEHKIKDLALPTPVRSAKARALLERQEKGRGKSGGAARGAPVRGSATRERGVPTAEPTSRSGRAARAASSGERGADDERARELPVLGAEGVDDSEEAAGAPKARQTKRQASRHGRRLATRRARRGERTQLRAKGEEAARQVGVPAAGNRGGRRLGPAGQVSGGGQWESTPPLAY